ncbi:MAG: transporter [Luteitalea sp.]|nr:transporter [Luteitalea sp.]
MVGMVLFGAWFSRSQRDVKDYFVSGHRVPWWAIMGSIVATETSTVTFISVPGLAYAGDFRFLQLVIGYLVGRVVVVLLFVPAYFRGELLTVYQLLGQRFGNGVKRLVSAIFIVTRSFADGFRLFATGLVLAALLLSSPRWQAEAQRWFPNSDPMFVMLVLSITVIAAATMVYTYLGGITAVIWTDVVQLIVYLTGALIAAAILIGEIPGGWAELARTASAAQKLRMFDFTWDITRDYTFWSGVVGGAFLTTATHGTDQLMVQRYLCSPSAREARLALLVSGVVVFLQFALFLGIGTMLYVYYTGSHAAEIARFTVDGRLLTDRIFPTFIVTHLPSGLVGLISAAVFAAAMSTLSSSLNSSAAAAVGDFYMPATEGRRSAPHYLRVARWTTALFGVAQLLVAIAAIRLSQTVVNEVLGIASFTNGIVLGVFLLGTLTTNVSQRAAVVGIAAGTLLMLLVKLATPVSWQWYVLIGSVATFVAGQLAARLAPADAEGGGG